MKTKTTITISVVAALAVGFLAGKFQASNSWAELYTRDTYQRDAGDVGSFATLLTELQAGHETDAINSLEMSLDGALLSLDHLPRKQWTSSIRAAVIQARACRVKYPWDKTPPQIQPSVQRALDSVKSEMPPNTALEPTPTAP